MDTHRRGAAGVAAELAPHAVTWAGAGEGAAHHTHNAYLNYEPMNREQRALIKNHYTSLIKNHYTSLPNTLVGPQPIQRPLASSPSKDTPPAARPHVKA